MVKPVYDKAAAKREKLRLKSIKLFNRITHPLGYGIFYQRGEWRFDKISKPKIIFSTYDDAIRQWHLESEITTPLDDNTARRLLEGEFQLENKGVSAKNTKKRRYIPAELGVEGLFDKLNQKGVRYAVLRWFDTLPNVKPGEDIDILFSDEDMPFVDTLFLLHKRKGAIKCDLYSAGGLPGSSLDGIPYYEKRLAEEILDNTRLYANRYKVPDSWRHLLSLTYHVFYHKAQNSGLAPRKEIPPLRSEVDHDYAAILTGLAKENGKSLQPTLDGFFKFLKRNGWDASIDTARKLSVRRPGILDHYPKPRRAAGTDGELSIFVVRQWAYDRSLVPWVCQNLRNFGFDVKLVKELEKEEKQRAASRIRGGNWGAGPRPVSGGGPAALIVAYDYVPCPPTYLMQKEHPHVRNARVVRVKDIIRKDINKHVPKHLRTNPLHSSDDDIEAWDYLESVLPDYVDEVQRSVSQGFEGDPCTKLVLHRGRRAYSYVMFRDKKPCLLKIFSEGKEGRKSYSQEMYAMQTLGKEPWTPEWIDHGPNWMMMEYYHRKYRLDHVAEELGDEDRRKLAGKVLDLLFDIQSKGYAHRDAHAHNVFLYNGQLKIIDFETMSPQDPSIPFLKSYDVIGKGSKSPNATGRMCYTRNTAKKSFERVLGVNLTDAVQYMSRKF